MEVTQLRKGDVVKVMSGEGKGKTGKILRVDSARTRVYVEQVKMTKRRMPKTQKNPQGGTIETESPIHWSNVMLVNAAGKAVRMEKARKQAA